MNTNCDANNEAAKTLANMFAGITIAKTSASDGTITLTITDGDLRPTLLTNNTTRYSWKAEHPDFTIKRGSVSVTADSARISSSFHRPWKE